MTIRRLYNLPNCKLVVEGLSDTTITNKSDIRPMLSMLMSAECHFEGKGQPLTGGREFLESLVRAVSSYSQEFLSGVSSPKPVGDKNGKPALVALQKIDGEVHRLTARSEEVTPEASSEETQGRIIDLTTVQLFDLMEAVDQFFADPLTLPDLALQLRPVSKGQVVSQEPVAQKALPVAIGVSSLALAAIAFFLVPIPEVQRPKDPRPQPEGSSTNLETSGSPNLEEPKIEPSTEATGEISSPEPIPVENLEPSLNTRQEITDAQEIARLEEILYDKIDRAWRSSIKSEEDLIYRVSVASDGAIVGYNPINPESADEAEQTPLPELLYKPVNGSRSNEAVAEFRVEFFTAENRFQVSSWEN